MNIILFFIEKFSSLMEKHRLPLFLKFAFLFTSQAGYQLSLFHNVCFHPSFFTTLDDLSFGSQQDWGEGTEEQWFFLFSFFNEFEWVLCISGI